MLEVEITTRQNSCSTDFENESEKKQIAVNAFKTRVKSKKSWAESRAQEFSQSDYAN